MMYVSERFKARKEAVGWFVWDIKNRLYFWFPYEQVSEEELMEIVDNDYLSSDSSLWNDKRLCFRLSAPLRIYYDITYRCNLNCWYCYNRDRLNHSDELSMSQKKRIVDQMVESNVFKLSIAGGEPLLSDDLFEFVKYAVLNGISVSMTTNGTLISLQSLNELDLFDSINISIDNIGDPSNILAPNRPIKCSSQVDGIIQALPPRLLRKIGIKAVINPLDSSYKLQLNMLARYCVKRNIKKLKISILQEDGVNYTEALYRHTYELFHCIREVKEEYATLSISYNNDPLFSLFSISNSIVQSGCGCWKDLLIITPSGRIKPCLLFNEDYELASILDDSLTNIWKTDLKYKRLPLECALCQNYRSCLGGCTARRLLLGYEKDPLCMKYRKDDTIRHVVAKNEFQDRSLVYCFSHC